MLLHSTLKRSIDAGALSTVAKLDNATIDAQLRKFTMANFGDGQTGATLDSLTWTISSDCEGERQRTGIAHEGPRYPDDQHQRSVIPEGYLCGIRSGADAHGKAQT
jgi:hypothetical protein